MDQYAIYKPDSSLKTFEASWYATLKPLCGRQMLKAGNWNKICHVHSIINVFKWADSLDKGTYQNREYMSSFVKNCASASCAIVWSTYKRMWHYHCMLLLKCDKYAHTVCVLLIIGFSNTKIPAHQFVGHSTLEMMPSLSNVWFITGFIKGRGTWLRVVKTCGTASLMSCISYSPVKYPCPEKSLKNVETVVSSSVLIAHILAIQQDIVLSLQIKQQGLSIILWKTNCTFNALNCLNMQIVHIATWSSSLLGCWGL